MAQPTGGDLHVNVPLTNISIAYMQNEQDFIASRVFPPVPVDHKSNQYWRYTKGDWFRTQAQKRAPRTESAGTGWNTYRDDYTADVNAVHADVADQDRADADSNFNMDRDATLLVTRDLLLQREKAWVAAYFKTGVWSGNTEQTGAAAAGANQFIQWDRANSTPIEDIEEQRLLFSRKTGYKPNFIVMGPEVHSVLKNHSQLLARIIYTQKGVVTDDLIASLFEVDNVYVPNVVENVNEEVMPAPTTEAEDLAATDLEFLYGKSLLMGYAAPNPGLLIPSAGYSFEWTGYLGAAQRGSRITKFRMEHLKADRIEGESAYGLKVVATDMGIFFKTVVQ